MPVVPKRGIRAWVARQVFGLLGGFADSAFRSGYVPVSERHILQGLPRKARREMWRQSWAKFRVAGKYTA